jgi:hypothetical protein
MSQRFGRGARQMVESPLFGTSPIPDPSVGMRMLLFGASRPFVAEPRETALSSTLMRVDEIFRQSGYGERKIGCDEICKWLGLDRTCDRPWFDASTQRDAIIELIKHGDRYSRRGNSERGYTYAILNAIRGDQLLHVNHEDGTLDKTATEENCRTHMTNNGRSAACRQIWYAVTGMQFPTFHGKPIDGNRYGMTEPHPDTIMMIALTQAYAARFGDDAVDVPILRQFLKQNMKNPSLQRCVDRFVAKYDIWHPDNIALLHFSIMDCIHYTLFGNVTARMVQECACDNPAQGLMFNLRSDSFIPVLMIGREDEVYSLDPGRERDSTDLFKYLPLAFDYYYRINETSRRYVKAIADLPPKGICYQYMGTCQHLPCDLIRTARPLHTVISHQPVTDVVSPQRTAQPVASVVSQQRWQPSQHRDGLKGPDIDPFLKKMLILDHVCGPSTTVHNCNGVAQAMLSELQQLGYDGKEFSGYHLYDWLNGCYYGGEYSLVTISSRHGVFLQRMRANGGYPGKFGCYAMECFGCPQPQCTWVSATMLTIWQSITSLPVPTNNYIDTIMIVLIATYVQTYAVYSDDDAINVGILRQFLSDNLIRSNPGLQLCVDRFVRNIDMWNSLDVLTIARNATGYMIMYGNVLFWDKTELANSNGEFGPNLFEHLRLTSLHLVPEFKEYCNDVAAAVPA